MLLQQLCDYSKDIKQDIPSLFIKIAKKMVFLLLTNFFLTLFFNNLTLLI